MNSKNPNERIPDPIYDELVELFGEEKADEIVEREGIDFRYLSMMIFAEKFKRRFGVDLRLICAIVAFFILLSIFI